MGQPERRGLREVAGGIACILQVIRYACGPTDSGDPMPPLPVSTLFIGLFALPKSPMTIMGLA